MTNEEQSKRNYTIPLITITLLFFMWGFITCMNDILIPYLKELFNLTFFESMLVQFCFFGAYFIGSVIYFIISTTNGDPIDKVGYKKGILFGVFLAAFGCVLFYPAASFSSYGLFLGALFILGLGFTVLQITANAYVSLLGSEESASSRLNMTQAFNAFGTTIAPVLGGHLIFELFSEPDGSFSAAATKIPYLIFAGILVLVALIISRVKLPDFKVEGEEAVKGFGALQHNHLIFGVFAMFCYVGGEVAVGSFIISFLEQPQIMNLSEVVSKNYLALYWGGAMIGRFLGAISLNQSISQSKKALYMAGAAIAVFLVIFSIVNLTFAQISFFLVFIALNFIAFFIGKSAPARTLSIFAAINVVLLISAMLNHGELAMYSILGIGIFNSIMFSNIFTLAISGLGKFTSQGSSLVVMAILGGAIVPIFQGYLADRFGVQHSFIIPVFCYIIILIFGFYCSKYLSHVKQDAEVKSGH
ncbi:MFS transporter, FHS family, L-fucose permease [Chishuiella changwenlii]|uniref:MFS transporter, FHS family, L-fucose permease n=2 Tax=Chishuiella changwenlii TaxID=1434701 RepID=A0A1M6Y7F8_9FLAO|nr:sugar MFS transporter [Chishuiella changwenlii]SHL13955.1 MFS transporter, FHS family, L-fucose permease [Chishuiella changwenlii]